MRRRLQIKRPLLVYMVLWILGELIALYAGMMFFILAVSTIIIVQAVYIKKKDIKYILPPVFLTLGFISMMYFNLVTKEPGFISQAIEDSTDITVTGTVESIINKEEKYQLILNRTEISDGNNQFKSKKILVYLSNSPDMEIGNIVSINGTLSYFNTPTNRGEFDLLMYYKSQSVMYMLYEDSHQIVGNRNIYVFRKMAYNISCILKKSLYSICDEKNASVFSAIILGDKKNLDEETYNLYKENGISHILAISGLHISLIGMSLYKIFRKSGISYTISAILGAAIIIFYGLMTGMGISSQRAIIMFVICVLADVCGRTYDILSAVSLSAMVMLAFSPYLLYNSGFQLSYMAVAGITVVSPVITKNVKNKIEKSLLSSLAINLATFPIILSISFEYPVYSVFLNLIILPVVPAVIFSGAIGAIAGVFSIIMGKFIIGTGVFVLLFYEKVCMLFEMLPLNTIVIGKPEMWQIIIYYIFLVVGLYVFDLKRKRAGVLFAAAAIVAVCVHFYMPLEVTFIDVGQGDGCLIRDYRGTTYLIDGGSSSESNIGKYTLVPVIKSYGESEIDYAVITHADSDHYSGIVEIMESGDIKINNLIMGDIANKSDNYNEIVELAVSKGINVIYLSDGMEIKNGRFSLKCIGPEKNFDSDDTNAGSIVLWLNYKDVDMLFTGDVQEDGEEYITKNLEKYKDTVFFDVLKVAHHGSANSTKDSFLQSLNCEYAIISCGKDNSYGHPHKDTTDRLESAGMEMYMTMNQGMITVKSGGRTLEIMVYLCGGN